MNRIPGSIRETKALLILCCVVVAFVSIACPHRTGNNAQSPAASTSQPTTLATPQSVTASGRPEQMSRVLAPARGCLYHGFHPGGDNGEEDVVIRDPASIASYKDTVGHQPAFVYFSHEWGHDKNRDKDVLAHDFPLNEITRISDQGRIPFIRLMLRTSSAEASKKREDYFTLENILGTNPKNAKQQLIKKEIQTDLQAWGRRAREEYKKPLIVEWGTEANNRTFHWNAANQKGDKSAATALFRRAFRYIVHTVSEEHPEQSNIVWVFHVTAESDPDTTDSKYRGDDWNRMGQYFPDGVPGEDEQDVVDWLGVSIYGTTNLDTGQCAPFATQLTGALGRSDGTGSAEKMLALANRGRRRGRPIFILEFGTALNYGESKHSVSECRPQTWISEAFTNIFQRTDEGVLAGFSWWNERYDDEGSKTLELRFDHLRETKETPANASEVLAAYRSSLDDGRIAHAEDGTSRALTCRVLTSSVEPTP